MGLSSNHPLVKSAVYFLVQSLDQKTKTWRVVPLDVNEYPHAPWWHDEDGSLARTFDDFLVIPRAGILASLSHYVDLLQDKWLVDLIEKTLSDILIMDQGQFDGGGDALVYVRRFAESINLPIDKRKFLISRVRELASSVVTREPDEWSNYCAPPLKLAPTPGSITANVLSEYIPRHLDYLIDNQESGGYWDVTWSWSDYLDVWKTAKQEWRGILTLDVLQVLKAYNRLGNQEGESDFD
jgi:hypothetical protein